MVTACLSSVLIELSKETNVSTPSSTRVRSKVRTIYVTPRAFWKKQRRADSSILRITLKGAEAPALACNCGAFNEDGFCKHTLRAATSLTVGEAKNAS